MSHLHFVIPIRHPSTVIDKQAQYRILNQTFRSIAGQSSDNWSAWVVANEEQRLPPLPSKFNFLPVQIPPEPRLLTAKTRQEHWSAVRLDKGKRVLRAFKCLPENETMMVVDDDDLVSKDLSSFVSQTNIEPGYFIGDGYMWREDTDFFSPISDFHKKCGTSLLVRVGYYRAFLLSDEEAIAELGSHHLIVDRAEHEGMAFKKVPFRGAVYRIGSANADSANVAAKKPMGRSTFTQKLKSHILFKYLKKIRTRQTTSDKLLASTVLPISVNLSQDFFGPLSEFEVKSD